MNITKLKHAYLFCGMALLSALMFLPTSWAYDIPPLSASKTITVLPAARHAIAVPEDQQVFYHIDDVSEVENNKGVRRQTISGDTISVSVYQLDVGAVFDMPFAYVDAGEYVIFVVDGTIEIGIEARQVRIASMGMAALPVDGGRSPARIKALGETILLVFSTIVPTTQPKENSPITRKEKTTASHSVIFRDLDNIKWNESVLKAAFGHRCTVSLWRNVATGMRGVYVPGHHHDIEQISLIITGHAKVRVGSRIREVAPGHIMLIPANADHGPIAPVGNETVLMLDFQPVVRSDLRQRMAQ